MDLKKFAHITKCTLRVMFVILTNLYCIPTYLMWMWVIFLPLRIINHPYYWYMEGVLYKWLLGMVASWSWQAQFCIVEVGDDVTSCVGQRCLLLVNHQSTADVPMLMAAFHAKDHVLASVMWIMDRMFRYTNFGAVSVTHGDYFITQGKNAREEQMKKLEDHLLDVYLLRNREWIILFPEGGFLSKRKETSMKYAKENNFPILKRVTLPRIGAMHLVMKILHPTALQQKIMEKGQPILIESKEHIEPLKWVIDVTVGYPESQNPLDLLAICSSNRPPCTTYIHYRCYPVEDVPLDSIELLRDWVYDRWSEKEELLDEYYSTGKFPQIPSSSRKKDRKQVDSEKGDGNIVETAERTHKIELNNFWIGFLHVFFLSSSYLHYYLLRRLWSFSF